MFAIPLDPVKTAKDLFYANWGGYNKKLWRLYRYDNSFIEYGADGSYKPSAGEVFWLKTSTFIPAAAKKPASQETTAP